MKKSLKFTIETQTEQSDIVSILHLNERTISLELSDVARKMFKLNKSLFDKINSSTKLLSGRIYREQITKSKQDKNKLGVQLLDKYESEEVLLTTLHFVNDSMPKRQSLLTKNNKRADFDPNNLSVKDGDGPFDPQNITYDDVVNSTIVCEIEEIQLFQDSGIKSFLLTDFMSDAEGLYQVAYRVEIRAETKFKDYVKYITKELEKSISFLASYLNSINTPGNYNSKAFEFKKSFEENIMNQLGLSQGIVNLGSNRVKNSEFGRASLNYYNGLILLESGAQSSIYSEIIKKLLPSKKTNPEIISRTLEQFRKLHSLIQKEYGLDNDKISDQLQIKISSKKNAVKQFITSTTEKLIIEREPLGYNVFSENQTGLNKFTTSTYQQRVGAEQAKYYPAMDVSDDTNFMTSAEKARFGDLSNASSFITPANLVLGNKRITCSRGMNNIDVNVIREFRVAKSARAVQATRTNYPSGLAKASLSRNVMADFNITIGVPRKPLLERSIDTNIDPLVDAKYYVGESSYFTTNNPELIFKNFKRLLKREDARIFAIVSDVIPGRFLRQNRSIENVKELQLANKNSKIRALVSDNMIEIEQIPPQIKSMMTKSFQNNPNIDPLQNRESRAVIDETMKNIFLVRAHVGFEKDSDGFMDLNKPIVQDMSTTSGTGPFLAKAYNYELPELGIVKDKFMPTIYNNLLYVRG